MNKGKTAGLVVVLALLAAAGYRYITPAKQKTVSVLVQGNAEELKAFRTLVESFHSAQSTIKISLIEAADRNTMMTRLSTSMAAGNPPDLFVTNYRYVAKFAAKNVLEPLDPFIEKSSVFKESDFYQQALDGFKFNNTQVCLPQNISSLVVYYNRSMFQSAGIPDPSADWTWDDMIVVAKKLTKDTNNDGKPDVFGLGVDPTLIRLTPFVWSSGGSLVDTQEAPSKFTLDDPKSIDMMRKFVELNWKDKVVPDVISFESEDNESRFTHGGLGMVMSSRRATPTFRTITDFDWDVAPLPILGQKANILHSDGFCMPSQSKYKQEAWTFMEYALSPQGQTMLAKTGRTVPSLKSVSTSDVFLDPSQNPAHSQVFLDSIPTLKRYPSVIAWAEIEKAADLIVEQIFYREGNYTDSTVPNAVQNILKETTPLFSKSE